MRFRVFLDDPLLWAINKIYKERFTLLKDKEILLYAHYNNGFTFLNVSLYIVVIIPTRNNIIRNLFLVIIID